MPKVYSNEIKQEVRNLRSKGWSLGEISLKMAMPKNTLSGWVKDITLTKAQRKRIKGKEILSAAIGRPLAARLIREKMEKWKEGIRKKVRHFRKLSFQNKELKKFTCAMLYLCEGGKYPATRFLQFVNSDPKMIYLFLKLLRDSFSMKEHKFRCQILYRWDQNFDKLKQFWSKLTNIPLNQFYNSTPDKRTKDKITQKIDYKGVCKIIYCDTNIQMELQAIGEEVLEGGGAGGVRTLETSCVPRKRSPN